MSQPPAHTEGGAEPHDEEEETWGLADRLGCWWLRQTGRLLRSKRDPGLARSPAIKAQFTLEAAAACRQMICVSAARFGTSRATITLYGKPDRNWETVIGPAPAQLGPRGLTTRPSELDWFTPVGVYAITHTFGSRPSPGGRFPYHQCDGSEYWVDDIDSPLYNTWQLAENASAWESAEHLVDYPYAIAFDFNQDPVVRDGNSAIFLHEGEHPTAGCVAFSQDLLVQILQWLDPALAPHVVLGVDLPGPALLLSQIPAH